MRRSFLPLTLAALTVLFSGHDAAANASRFTVFVDSRRGTDWPNCGTIGSPCKTFQQAVDRVVAGGKVIAKESGEYGPITITKAVTVEAAPGVEALIATASDMGIDVNAGDADTVTVRGLTLVSQHSTQEDMGIRFIGGRALHVERCVIDGYALGIYASVAAPPVAEVPTPPSPLLFVSDTTIRSCYEAAVSLSSGSPLALMRASFDRCRFEDSSDGLVLWTNGIGVVRDSVFTGMQNGGVAAFPGAGGTRVEINLENCLIAYNSDGVVSDGRSGGSATVRISNCTITDNLLGAFASQGGVILSRGNNTIEGNGTDVVGALGTYSAK